MINILISLAAAALVVTEAPAPDLSDWTVMRIDFGDLDLTTRAGRAEFDRRVEQAAARICNDWPVKVTLSQRQEIDDCKKSIYLDAAREISRATGSALARSGLKQPKL